VIEGRQSKGELPLSVGISRRREPRRYPQHRFQH